MKFSKKAFALILSILLILGCMPLSGAAQTGMPPSGSPVVQGVDNLVNGEYYYIRNAGSGKYLTVEYYNAYQSEFNPENDEQKFQYIVTEDGIELCSLYGDVGCNMDLRYLNVAPRGKTGWAIQNNFMSDDGSMILCSIGATQFFPGQFYYMTSGGDGDYTNVLLTNNQIDSYLLWYFEKVN